MSHEPSFYQMFRRSLYSAENCDFGLTPQQNRTEVFTVAALGFVLNHDRNFKEFFLRTVCRATGDLNLAEYVVECQSADCSDLAIVKDGEAAFIIEAKVKARLEPRQKPWEEELFNSDKGYGGQIRQMYKDCPRKTYIILQNHRELKVCDSRPPGKDPIICLSRTWEDLVAFEKNGSESNLVEDMLDSLAQFDIPAFKNRILQEKKMKEHTRNTAAMYGLLKAIARDYKFDPKAIDSAYSSDSSYFGLDIPKSPDRFSQLGAVVQNDGPLGWFGYQIDNQGEPNLAVTFYCGAGTRSKAEEFVRKRGVPTSKIDKDYFSVTQPPDWTGNDLPWFASIFEKLQDR